MGIRKTIQAARDKITGEQKHETADGPLITEAARDKIRRTLKEKDQDGLVFHVSTVPTKIGFSVKVGFDVINHAEHRQEFGGLPVVVSPEDWTRLHGFTIDLKDDSFVSLAGVTVHVSETPNPEARKFSVNRKVMDSGSATFQRSHTVETPILIELLFRLQGVGAVFCIQSFVTITREDDRSWDELVPEVGKTLQAYFAHGGNPLMPEDVALMDSAGIEAKIIQILEDFVRPQVQKDGGDIVFAGYDRGTVSLHMQGSCVGCPSSTATLKMGIENLLKEAIPEVQEVVAVS